MQNKILVQERFDLYDKRLLIVTDSRVWVRGEGRNLRFTSLVQGLYRYGLIIDLVTSRKTLSTDDVECLRSVGIDTIITGSHLLENMGRSTIRSKIRCVCPDFIIIIFRILRSLKHKIASIDLSKKFKTRSLAELKSPILSSLVEEYVRKHAPEFIMVEYLMHGYALDFLKTLPTCERPVTMIDTHDVTYQRCESLSRLGVPLPFSISKEEEQRILADFDIIIAIHDEDKKVFQKMLPNNMIVTCLPAFSVVPLKSSPAGKRKSLLFVAGNSELNVAGLRDFLKNSWPLVRKEHPDATLTVVGKICRNFDVKYYPGVSFKGYLVDLHEAYAMAEIVISPITFGSGLKIKVLEALSYGRPVVATAHSAIGFSNLIGHGLLVADDWDSFAMTLADLLGNFERVKALGKAAADHIISQFKESVVMQDLIAAMRTQLELGSKKK